MKKLMVLAAVVMVSLVSAGTVRAATQTVAVSANVVGVCQFLGGAGTLSFTLDPSGGGAVDGTPGQPSFWCTNGTTWTITDDDGLHEAAGSHRMQHATSLTDYIPYSFTYTTTGTGSGRNTTINMDIAGQVAAADYLDALGGNYADTVTLTINP